MRTCLILVLSFIGLGLFAADDMKSKYNPGSRDTELIMLELKRCPCWRECAGDETELRVGITRLYSRLSRFDTTALRNGIGLYLERIPAGSEEEMSARAKVFALLRVVFDVPDSYVAIEWNVGSWGSPMKDGRVNLLWPFTRSESGELQLQGVSANAYFGPAYDPLAEFDQMAARYQRRPVPTEAKPKGMR